jgi:hypothetical protein
MSWKIAFALSIAATATGVVAGGCSTDVCTRADDQLAACADPTVTLPSLNTNNNNGNECTAHRACQSDCINNATCTEINDALCIQQISCRPLSQDAGTPSSAMPSAFIKCMKACGAADDGGS